MMNLQTYKTVIVPAHRSYWHGATSNAALTYNLFGPHGLSNKDFDEAPSNLLSSVFLSMNQKEAHLTLKYFEHIREIFPVIAKKTSIYDAEDSLSYHCFRKFYSDNQIQELLQKIYTFSNQILIEKPKIASKLLRIGMKIATGQPEDSFIEFQLKRQFGLIQILQEKSDYGLINSYEQLLSDALKKPCVVPASEIAAIKSHLGCMYVLKALTFSKELEDKNLFKTESGFQFYKTLGLAESLLEVATVLDPENKVHKINKLVLKTLVIGAHIYQPFYYASISKTGVIKLLPTLLRNLENSVDRNKSNITIYQDLIKLHKAEIKNKISKQSKVLLLNQPEPLGIEKPKTSEQLLIASNKKQNRKKRSGE